MDESDSCFTVIVSERAAEMLLEHVRFVSQVSQQAAEDLRRRLIEAAKSLEVHPARHPYLNDPLLTPNRYRKMVVNKRYMLIYQIKGQVVYIDYCLDCRQAYQWML